jgi:hypothetical protein
MTFKSSGGHGTQCTLTQRRQINYVNLTLSYAFRLSLMLCKPNLLHSNSNIRQWHQKQNPSLLVSSNSFHPLIYSFVVLESFYSSSHCYLSLIHHLSLFPSLVLCEPSSYHHATCPHPVFAGSTDTELLCVVFWEGRIGQETA